jgi:cell division protein YceG involved in septum cleavage
MVALLKTHSLTFLRNTVRGHYDAKGDYVLGTEVPLVDVLGSLQPFKSGSKQMKLPEGITTESAKIFYTQTELLTASQFTKLLADYCLIGGLDMDLA